jgi:hypothetical protein
MKDAPENSLNYQKVGWFLNNLAEEQHKDPNFDYDDPIAVNALIFEYIASGQFLLKQSDDFVEFFNVIETLYEIEYINKDMVHLILENLELSIAGQEAVIQAVAGELGWQILQDLLKERRI